MSLEQQPTDSTQESWDYNPQQNPEQANEGTADQLPNQSIESGIDPASQLAQQQSQEQFVPESQYRSLQAGYTQSRQELAELQRRNQMLTDTLLSRQTTQQQPLQQQQSQSIWDLPEEDLSGRLQKNFKGTLRELITAEAEALADKKLSGVREDLVATQAILNEQRLNATMNNLGSRYGNVPDYQNLLSKAVDYVTGAGINEARRDPAGALERQFKYELYSAAEQNPAILAAIRNDAQARNTQLEADKRMAAPMTTRSNVSQPAHQPLVQPNGVTNNAQIARQISTYGNDDFWQGGRQFNASFSEY